MNPEPRIVHRPAFWVVGMRISTRVMAAEIPALWQRFVPRMGDVARIAEPGVSYGVMDRFDPAAGTLDYMAAVAVNDPEELPEGMVGAEIPANT